MSDNGEKKGFISKFTANPPNKKMNYKLKRVLIFWGAFLVIILLGFLIWWVISIV